MTSPALPLVLAQLGSVDHLSDIQVVRSARTFQSEGGYGLDLQHRPDGRLRPSLWAFDFVLRRVI